MNSNSNVTKANKNSLITRKGLGKHMAYELNKVNNEENYEKDAKKINNNKSVTSFLNLIQSMNIKKRYSKVKLSFNLKTEKGKSCKLVRSRLRKEGFF